MARKPKNRITAWSYSRYAAYNKCPFKLKCSAILRIKEPPNYAMDRGTDIHNKGEQYLLGNIRGVPREFKEFKEEIKTIKDMGAAPEVDLTIAKDFTPSAGDDWSHAWLRAKVDADVPHETEEEVTVVDYKTGKFYDSHEDQGEIYAVNKMVFAPKAKVVDVEFWYLDIGDTLSLKFERKEFNRIKKKWVEKSKSMLTDTRFEPNPGAHCNKCFYSSKHGNGPCKY